MPARLFFSMLNESYRLDAQEKIQLLSIINSVNYSAEGRNSLYRSYTQQSEDLIEITGKPNDDYSGLDILEDWLG